MVPNTNPAKLSSWTPFRHRVFAVIWTAAFISNVGTWMHAIGAGWLMTSLNASPVTISFVYVASTLPMFLFAIPAGALSDVFDRRQILIASNIAMAFVAVIFAIAIRWGSVTTEQLLLATFLLATGTAFVAPAWQAVIPQLVPRDDLPSAVALNGVSINLSRAIGPALAGALITSYGLYVPFSVNAASFLFIIAALLWWTPATKVQRSRLPPERFLAAVVVGFRHVRHNRELMNIAVLVAGFMFFANALWALLPLVARDLLVGQASLYGLLLGAVGAGGVLCALTLPKLSARLSSIQLIIGGSLATSLVMVTMGTLANPSFAVVLSLVFGIGWMMVLTALNVGAQLALPDWVKARGMAIYLTVFFGGMTFGSLFWGWFASQTSVGTALWAAGVGGVIVAVLSSRVSIESTVAIDHAPSLHWPVPVTYRDVDQVNGNSATVVTYPVQEEHQGEFLALIHQLKDSRMRNGSYEWSLYRSAANPNVFLEIFMDSSWVDHLRQHERVSESDRIIQERISGLLNGDGRQVEHFISADAEFQAIGGGE